MAMKNFKEVFNVVIRPIGILCFGGGIGNLIVGDYKLSSISLLITSILFIIGYFAERWGD
jgi:hypothetical protein